MNATLGTRLLGILDRLTARLYHPHRAPIVRGGYDRTSLVIPGHALVRLLRSQHVAPRSRRLPA